MTTPKQDDLVIDTPFCTATIHDARYYDDTNRVARIKLDRPIINRKPYNKEVTLYVTAHDRRLTRVVSVSPETYEYRDFTDSARSKLSDFFEVECADLWAPYLEPIDPDVTRAQIKRSLHAKIGRSLSNTYDEFRRKAEPELINELMDELLADAIEARGQGVSYGKFYTERY